MQILRVAVIGGGFIGKQHIEAIRRIPGTEVVALSERREDAAKALAEELYIPAWYTDYTQMLDEVKPDVVHICTPNNTHFAIAKDVIERGIYAYCEKPLGMNSEETTQLAELVTSRRTKADVNYATFTEADYVVRIVEACLKSAKEGRWVDVEPSPIYKKYKESLKK